MDDFIYDKEILLKRMAIPKKLAELSYLDQDAAVHYMRIWGEKKMPITTLFDELNTTLAEKAS
ncbi:hypothetical protein [Domibacillus aminovorans]|uniref:Uncharacterized protein n=1 Tax=Domibacillus aminovorans TaxID=29332 RepID=A0A177L3W9_9BACI|nr:hypothetical protein [Domibacillus aminovorans]OAH60106.1 hypothetical protein AWH49_18045 [Domibacillus aminovorans]